MVWVEDWILPCAGGEERETVFCWDLSLWVCEIGLVDFEGDRFDLGVLRPEMRGGGRSRSSEVLRDSCLAKSEACHHSRNLRANIVVGRRILRLESNRG